MARIPAWSSRVWTATTSIYFPQNNKDCTVNQIVIYDWDGNYINTVRVGSFQEIEDVFHVGDDLYIAFNASGSYVYQGRLEEIKQ